MKRTINFYQPIFYKKTDFLSASYLGLFMGTSILFLSFFSMVEHWRAGKEGRALTALQETHKQATQQLEDIKKQFPEKTEAVKALEETGQLERLLSTKLELLNKMTDKALQEGRGFSDFLKGLARSKAEGLWLERIHLRAGGNQITLSGQTLRPEAPFLLLQRLSQESAFRGREFNTFALQQSENAVPAVKFVLQTEEGLEKEAENSQEKSTP